MDLLKAAILVKLTKSGKPFHMLMTLQAKKIDSSVTTSWLEKFVRMPPGRQCGKFKKINKIQFCKPKNNFIAVNKVKV